MVAQLDFKTQKKYDNLVEIKKAFEAVGNADKDIWSLPKRARGAYAHSLFQYPAMMVPEVQKQIIELIKKHEPHIKTALDPYVGAGTSITAAMMCGLNATGQDINPLAILVSKAKTDLSWSEDELLESFDKVVHNAIADKSLVVDVNFPNMRKWFKLSASRELSKLRRAILNQPNIVIRRVLWAALAETIRITSNDRTTTYKLHARPKEEIQERHISPIKVFKNIARGYVVDLVKYKKILMVEGFIQKGNYVGQINIIFSDTKKGIRTNSDKKFDLIITSPPYGDNLTTITYGQHAYLPLQWIDLKDDLKDVDENVDAEMLRTTHEIDRRSLGGKKPLRREIDTKIKELSVQSGNLQHIFSLLNDKPSEHISKVVGFYEDFITALKQIVESLADHGYMVWTIGNRRVNNIEVPNDQILIDILKRYGINLVVDITRTIHNRRMPKKNQIAQMMYTEKILVFKKG
jgi:DNA modification methylase